MVYRHKHSKEFILKALDTVVLHVEGESNEQRRQDGQHELSTDIDGAAVIMLESSNGDCFKLSSERHGKC